MHRAGVMSLPTTRPHPGPPALIFSQQKAPESQRGCRPKGSGGGDGRTFSGCLDQ
jgi:hypothetical protein